MSAATPTVSRLPDPVFQTSQCPPRTRSGAIAWSRLPEPVGEIEITLAAGSAEVLDQVWTAADITRHARSAGRSLRLETTYHDTPDGRLRDRKAALRLRRFGKRIVQTLKSSDPGDPVRRGEWEVAVPRAAYDLPAFQSPAALSVLEGVDPSDLRPILATRILRRAKVLEIPNNPETGDGAAVIDLALDHGTVDAAGLSQPIADVELELKRGDPAALFTLAAA